MSGIYQIRNLINNRLYIGSAKDFMKRKKEHFRKLIAGTHPNKHLQSSWNKYGGESNFVFEPIEYTNIKNLLLREQYYIDFYGIKDLYNICPKAGNSLGRIFSDETKALMSKRKLGMYLGTKNPRASHIYEYDDNLNFIKTWFTGKECATQYNISRGNLSHFSKINSNNPIRYKKLCNKIFTKHILSLS